MVHIDLDTNAHPLVQKLLYFLQKEGYLKECDGFILDDMMLSSGKTYFSIFPKEEIAFTFKEHKFFGRYMTNRMPKNFNMQIVRFEQMRITTDEYEHLLEFLRMLQDLKIPEEREGELCKYIWSPDEIFWKFSGKFKARKLDSVYLPTKDEICNTLDQFLNDSERQSMYERLDIPYRCVFFLYGPPGTGKTSLIRALASKMQYHLAVVKNIKEMDDLTLEMMLNNLRKRSFLVFEDIDCLFEQRHAQQKSNVSYSGLLNMLDGIGNYDKLVVFITTNHIHMFDHAFKRRVDRFVEFTYTQRPEIIAMYRNFFATSTLQDAEAFADRVARKKLTVNILEKYFMHCLQKNELPSVANHKFLNDYDAMVSDFSADHLYS